MTERDALARLIIHMAAVIVWALSGKDKELYKQVHEQGEMKWEEMKGSR